MPTETLSSVPCALPAPGERSSHGRGVQCPLRRSLFLEALASSTSVFLEDRHLVDRRHPHGSLRSGAIGATAEAQECKPASIPRSAELEDRRPHP